MTRLIQMRFIVTLIMSLLLAQWLAACTPQQGVRQTPTAAQSAWDARRDGQHLQAAEAFLQVAQKSNNYDARYYRLQAAESYLDAGNPTAASQVLEKIPVTAAEDDFHWSEILRARAMAQQGQKPEGLARLEALPKEKFVGEQATRYQNALAEITGATPTTADGSTPASGSDPATNGVVTTGLEDGTQNNLTSLTGGSKPTQVALLLPLVGKLAEAALPIRQGFEQAANADAATDKPSVRVYNASHADILQVYDQAQSEGAELIVGPLEKPALDALIARGALPVTTLALNQASLKPGESVLPVINNLLQFSLSPEAEAIQAAERAFNDGHLRALILTPEDAWGARMMQAFRTRFQELGGQVMDTGAYPASGFDFQPAIRALLKVEIHDDRINEHGRKVKVPPTRRDDVDMIFIGANPPQARQIMPLLDFYNARDVAAYATSHIYSGKVDKRMDIDLNGIIFGDMPVILQSQEAGNTLMGGSGSQLRLRAFGADAYRLIADMANLTADPLAGVAGMSGKLSVHNGQVVRALTWAKIQDGQPQLLDNTSVTLLE